MPTAHTFAPRKAYGNGKLRDITKAQAAAFFAAVHERMMPWPVTDSDNDPGCHEWTLWTVPTAYGPLSVTVYADQELYFSIYCQFRGEGDYPASNDDPRLPLARKAFDLGPSCKWNVLEADAEAAMNCLEWRLRYAKAEGDKVGDLYS